MLRIPPKVFDYERHGKVQTFFIDGKRVSRAEWSRQLKLARRRIKNRKNPILPIVPMIPRTRSAKSRVKRHRARKRVLKNPQRLVKIYEKILRIEAQKGSGHRCDAACKRAGHRYYHVFKSKPQMWGLKDGSLLIK